MTSVFKIGGDIGLLYTYERGEGSLHICNTLCADLIMW